MPYLSCKVVDDYTLEQCGRCWCHASPWTLSPPSLLLGFLAGGAGFLLLEFLLR